MIFGGNQLKFLDELGTYYFFPAKILYDELSLFMNSLLGMGYVLVIRVDMYSHITEYSTAEKIRESEQHRATKQNYKHNVTEKSI